MTRSDVEDRAGGPSLAREHRQGQSTINQFSLSIFLPFVDQDRYCRDIVRKGGRDVTEYDEFRSCKIILLARKLRERDCSLFSILPPRRNGRETTVVNLETAQTHFPTTFLVGFLPRIEISPSRGSSNSSGTALQT